VVPYLQNICSVTSYHISNVHLVIQSGASESDIDRLWPLVRVGKVPDCGWFWHERPDKVISDRCERADGWSELEDAGMSLMRATLILWGGKP